MKATQSRVLAMSDMFRAVAGAPDAQFDMVACTVYSAAYHIMRSGNKTQFAKLEADASMYGVDSTEATKAIKAVLGVEKATPAVKRFRKTYFAIGEALRQCGMPSLVRDLPKAQSEYDAIIDPMADDYAQQFTAVFTAIMVMPEKTEAEKAEAAAKRLAAKAEKEALSAKQVASESEALEAVIAERVATVATPDHMARTVADMLSAGALSPELEALIIEAARVRETAMLLARVASAETEPA